MLEHQRSQRRFLPLSRGYVVDLTVLLSAKQDATKRSFNVKTVITTETQLPYYHKTQQLQMCYITLLIIVTIYSIIATKISQHF